MKNLFREASARPNEMCSFKDSVAHFTTAVEHSCGRKAVVVYFKADLLAPGGEYLFATRCEQHKGVAIGVVPG